MVKIKTPEFDRKDFMDINKDQHGNPPTIKRGMSVIVQYHDMEVVLKVTAFTQDPDYFTGVITEFEAPPEEYKDLSVGDKVAFHKDHIHSFHEPNSLS